MKFEDHPAETKREIISQIEEQSRNKSEMRNKILWEIIKLVSTLGFGSLVALFSYKASEGTIYNVSQFNAGVGLLISGLAFVIIYYFVNFLDLELQIFRFEQKVGKYYAGDESVSWSELWSSETGSVWYVAEFLLGCLFPTLVIAGIVFGALSVTS
jgi:hypothetical protein